MCNKINVLLVLGLLCVIDTKQKQVIDIFTNYPSTKEVLKDYDRLLESRHLEDSIKPPDYSSDFFTKTKSLDIPRTLTAKATTPVEFDKKKRTKESRGRYNSYDRDGYAYQQDYGYHGNQDYYASGGGGSGGNPNPWSNFHDFDHHNNHGSDEDLLESEFGTFETSRPHNNHQGYHDHHDLQAQASINHVSKPGVNNFLDLNNFMEVMATRPAFLTGTSLGPLGSGNRKNKTIVLPTIQSTGSPDYMDFDGDDIKNDALESDFGEIVSTTIDRHKNRKGNVKRIPKPTKHPNKNHNHHNQEQNKINKNHVGKLTAEKGTPNGKQKVTNLIRKYLIKMRNSTGSGIRSGNRKNRKQGNNYQNSLNDRTLDWMTNDKKTEIQTSVKLSEGSQKFLTSGHDYTSPLETIKNKTKHIANKFLSLFTVIQFANFKCQANSAVSQYEGTCFLASECSERNGIAMGMCAEGHGVCCVFRGTCGGVGSNNCTYFESPGYPNYFPLDGGVVQPTSSSTTVSSLTPDPRFPNLQPLQFLQVESRQSESANALSCIFRVYKASDAVKQMRIDFIDLELAGPTNGNCVDERLIISGTGLTTGVPAICGYNTGQHVLVDVTNLSGPLQLAVLANMINRKRYKIRICQYTDGCSGLMNCLQSYSGVTGMIQSFNYDQAVTFSRSTPGYFNNLNYAICIRREPGYCTITYTNIGPNGVVYPFELRNFDDDGSLSVPAGQAGAGVINCPDDYIVVNGIRLCGDRLNDGSIIDNFSANAPITDTSGGPIIIPVRTNVASTARGFKLFYTQNRCPTSGGSAGTPDPRI